ncbi:MAG: hypothetical protein NTX24_04470 [Candidatus Pacearchaeota archaeon]|nr:hypothetical protein [Candidatus Pacearchaeota archaeon]
MRKLLKNKKGVSAIVTTLIIGVIILILMVILWPRIIGPVLDKIFKTSGPTGEEVYRDHDNIFNALKSNIQACTTVDDENCVCKGWPDFPLIFGSNAILHVDNPKKNISLTIPTRDIWAWAYTNVFEYFSLGLTKKDQTIYVYTPGSGNYQTNSFDTIDITSSKFPEIDAKDGTAGKFGVITSEYFFKTNLKQNGAPILEIITRAGRADFASLNSEISGLPLCSEKRTTAIASFTKVVSAVSSAASGQEYTIADLPDGYSILVRKADKTLLLVYNNQVVKEISFVDDSVPAQNLFGGMRIAKMSVIRFEVKDVSSILSSSVSLCSDLQKTELTNGAKIQFKSEGGNTCLFAA